MKANSRNIEPVSRRRSRSAHNRGERDRHRDHRPNDFPRALQRRLYRRFALLQMAVDVLHHHDGVVDHEPDRQHHRQQRQQVEAEAHRQHQAADADQRQRNRDHGNDDRAERGQEQEDHHDHDQHGFAKRLLHLVDRRLNELGGIVGHLHLHRRRQVAFQLRKQRANALDQGQRIALRGRLHADENRALATESDTRICALGCKVDGGDILDPHETAVLGLDDHPLEFVEVPQVGVGLDIRDDEKALGLSSRGLEVVGLDRGLNVGRRYATARHLHWIEPQSHCECLPTENVGRRQAVNGRQQRMSMESVSPRSPNRTARRWKSRDTSRPWSARSSW